MKDTIKLILILLLLLGILGGAFFYLRFSSRIEENPENEIGNSAGNLNNEGLFCEKDGKIYFSNFYDNGALYSMNSDGSEITKLNKYGSKWINAAGDYLYYYENTDGASSIAGFGGHMMGIYRSRLDGSKTRCLDKTYSMVVSLYGNHLFYQHYTNINNKGMTLYRMHIDKKDYDQFSDEIINPACIVNGYIYYANYSGPHGMYRLSTANPGKGTRVFDGAVYNPIVSSDGSTVYYMNIADDYKIYKADLSSGTETQISPDRAECFNISDSYIFYQKNDSESPALMRCRLDGSDCEKVIAGNYNRINVTSKYTYFCSFGDNSTMLKVPSNSPGAATTCTEFSDAAATQE